MRIRFDFGTLALDAELLHGRLRRKDAGKGGGAEGGVRISPVPIVRWAHARNL